VCAKKKERLAHQKRREKGKKGLSDVQKKRKDRHQKRREKGEKGLSEPYCLFRYGNGKASEKTGFEGLYYLFWNGSLSAWWRFEGLLIYTYTRGSERQKTYPLQKEAEKREAKIYKRDKHETKLHICCCRCCTSRVVVRVATRERGRKKNSTALVVRVAGEKIAQALEGWKFHDLSHLLCLLVFLSLLLLFWVVTVL